MTPAVTTDTRSSAACGDAKHATTTRLGLSSAEKQSARATMTRNRFAIGDSRENKCVPIINDEGEDTSGL
uniref:Uncharacterized protein n=1 Tax=Oryza glumipatula TaxID=40148 RepID=A0A0D9ZHF2_9ORYZ